MTAAAAVRTRLVTVANAIRESAPPAIAQHEGISNWTCQSLQYCFKHRRHVILFSAIRRHNHLPPVSRGALMISRVLTALCLFLTATAAMAQESRPPPEAASGYDDEAARHRASSHGRRRRAPGRGSGARNPAARRIGRRRRDRDRTRARSCRAAVLRASAAAPFSSTGMPKSRTLATFDGRETAPAAAKPDRFMRRRQADAVRRRPCAPDLASACRGSLRTLEAVHRKYGKLPWAALFAPAIKLAENGFPVSPRLSVLLNKPTARKFCARGARIFL